MVHDAEEDCEQWYREDRHLKKVSMPISMNQHEAEGWMGSRLSTWTRRRHKCSVFKIACAYAAPMLAVCSTVIVATACTLSMYMSVCYA